MSCRLQLRITGLLVVMAMLCAGAQGQSLQAARVESIGFTVSNMDRSVEFYSRVLQFKKVDDHRNADGNARIVCMQLGVEHIELTEYDAVGRPFPLDSHANDHWFQHVAIVVSDMPRAYALMRKNRVRHASSAPQRLPDWNKNAAGIEAFYFRDPDGHFLELIHFPPAKGDSKWQRPTGELFLGIDHTAIVVADSDQSLRFYRDLLGLRVAGESENYGAEQEHLNGVFGAHLRITSLRTPDGPGIELLEYLSPTDGRETPPDLRLNDIAHWETRVEIDNTTPEQVRSTLKSAGVRLTASNSTTELVVEDPDRHTIVFTGAKQNSVSRIPLAPEF